MLSLAECRRQLGGLEISDDELRRVRDELEALAEVAISRVLSSRARRSAHLAAVELLCEDERAEFEERAAIMEFDGGLSRTNAERSALAGRVRRVRPGDGDEKERR